MSFQSRYGIGGSFRGLIYEKRINNYVCFNSLRRRKYGSYDKF